MLSVATADLALEALEDYAENPSTDNAQLVVDALELTLTLLATKDTEVLQLIRTFSPRLLVGVEP